MKCKDCKFYKETLPREKSGVCLIAEKLTLPPWVEPTQANIVGRNEGCDVGLEDDEL